VEGDEVRPLDGAHRRMPTAMMTSMKPTPDK
jgi:hypothetical protein